MNSGIVVPELQLSACHVYLNFPFVMSWILLEAMGCGCAVVVSDTAPVREVVRQSQNGLLLDFFSLTDLPRRWWGCSTILSVLLALERPHVRASNAPMN